MALPCSGTQGGGLRMPAAPAVRLPWQREGGPPATSVAQEHSSPHTAAAEALRVPVARAGSVEISPGRPCGWRSPVTEEQERRWGGQQERLLLTARPVHQPHPVALIRFVLRRTGLQSGVAWGAPTPLCRPRKYPDLPGQAGKTGSHFAENWLPHIFCFNQARNI